jgi:hypothetical protein
MNTGGTDSNRSSDRKYSNRSGTDIKTNKFKLEVKPVLNDFDTDNKSNNNNNNPNVDDDENNHMIRGFNKKESYHEEREATPGRKSYKYYFD